MNWRSVRCIHLHLHAHSNHHEILTWYLTLHALSSDMDIYWNHAFLRFFFSTKFKDTNYKTDRDIPSTFLASISGLTSEMRHQIKF